MLFQQVVILDYYYVNVVFHSHANAQRTGNALRNVVKQTRLRLVNLCKHSKNMGLNTTFETHAGLNSASGVTNALCSNNNHICIEEVNQMIAHGGKDITSRNTAVQFERATANEETPT